MKEANDEGYMSSIGKGVKIALGCPHTSPKCDEPNSDHQAATAWYTQASFLHHDLKECQLINVGFNPEIGLYANHLSPHFSGSSDETHQ
jgi:hypothetical protein